MRSMLLRSVVGKTLRDGRRGLVGWSLGIAVLVLITCSVYPSIRDNADLQRAVEDYPEELKAFIGGSLDFSTGPGYLQGELFSLMLPLLLLVYGIAAGARALAGEEEAGTLDLLLANPVSRERLALEKLAALAALLALLAAVTFLLVAGSDILFSMDVGAGPIAAATLVTWLLALLHGTLALLVGAATGSRALAIAAAASVAVAGYLLDGLGNLVDVLEPLQPFAPWHWYTAGDTLRNGLDLGWTLLLAAATVVLAAAAPPLFARRDLSV